MCARSRRTPREAGFTLPELIAVFAIVAILTALTIPVALSFIRSSTAMQGARDLRTRLTQARMLAVTNRQPVCVNFTPAGYQFLQNTCAGAPIQTTQTGPNGVVGYAELVTVAGVSPVFTQFGNATQNTVLTVTSQGGNQMTVTVSLSGRITIP